MKKILFIFIAIINLTAFSENIQDISFNIRFFDKKVYFPESDIKIKVEITNNSPQTYHFKAAQDRLFNMDFSVKSLTNVSIKHSEKFIIERNSNQQVYYREIALEPGEQFSFVEDLKGYIDLSDPGVFVVQADFYPELVSGSSMAGLKSNFLTLSVRPSAGFSELEAKIDQETGEILKKLALPPDEVVSYTIEARQKSEWNKFFLYIDSKELMIQDPNKKRKFTRLSEKDQRAMVNDFVDGLKTEKMHDDIIMVPNEYRIIKTSYTEFNAQVEVLQKFSYPDFTEIKQYTYHLYRKDGIWYISNYQVKNLGTE